MYRLNNFKSAFPEVVGILTIKYRLMNSLHKINSKKMSSTYF